ncbi:MAG: caspase family protein, partial [Treponema sp.]|nr:caspase family protein [Treponema sp.]
MKIFFYTALFLLFSTFLFAQDAAPAKYALVIGNGNYSGGLSALANPLNDALDMSAALGELGFEVETLTNAGQEQMEDGITRFRDKLGREKNAYGFFFYAGHGVQSNGENYLIPVDADIPRETYLQQRAVWVQAVLDDLNTAGNSLNIVVLDACRDNPFSWSRSTGNRGRGLVVINQQPADSIVVYATSAGQTAEDGEGRNGLFTGQLLKNIRTPGIEVNELFRRTGADVSEVSNRKQIPAIYNQFFGTAYLGGPPSGTVTAVPARPVNPPQAPQQGTGGNAINARLWSVGASAGTAFSAPWVIGTIRGT